MQDVFQANLFEPAASISGRDSKAAWSLQMAPSAWIMAWTMCAPGQLLRSQSAYERAIALKGLSITKMHGRLKSLLIFKSGRARGEKRGLRGPLSSATKIWSMRSHRSSSNHGSDPFNSLPPEHTHNFPPEDSFNPWDSGDMDCEQQSEVLSTDDPGNHQRRCLRTPIDAPIWYPLQKAPCSALE